MGKTNANKVLGTFRNNYEDRKKSMMKSYKPGGATDANCTTVMVNGKPKKRCKQKSGKRGGKLKKVLGAVAGAAATIGAGIAGSKALKAFKNNGGF
jgi:hypothetical protein